MVASNFLPTAEKMAAAFEAETGHSVTLSSGATGLLFVQIEAGAAVDILLAADDERPAQLLRDGRASDTATYALGGLAVASRVPLSVETAGEVFAGQIVALADPILAPYGKASTTAMERLGLDTATFTPLVVANAGQVVALFDQGEAAVAFVPASAIPDLTPPHVLELEGLSPELRQDAALLSPDNPAAVAFWTWLQSDAGRAMIADAGYGLP